jgi:hypothetical protein
MNTDITSAIARRAAGRLADPFGHTIGDEVERELARDPLDRRPERILDPISLAALIVSLASFGWSVYRDIKKDRDAAKASRADMERRVAALLRQQDSVAAGRLPSGMTEAQQAIVIDAVAVEIVAAAPLEG